MILFPVELYEKREEKEIWREHEKEEESERENIRFVASDRWADWAEPLCVAWAYVIVHTHAKCQKIKEKLGDTQIYIN